MPLVLASETAGMLLLYRPNFQPVLHCRRRSVQRKWSLCGRSRAYLCQAVVVHACSVSLSLFALWVFVSISVRLFVFLCLSLSVSVYVSVFVHLYLRLCLCLYLRLCLPLHMPVVLRVVVRGREHRISRFLSLTHPLALITLPVSLVFVRYSQPTVNVGPNSLFFKLSVHYADGTKDAIVSDLTWKVQSFVGMRNLASSLPFLFVCTPPPRPLPPSAV